MAIFQAIITDAGIAAVNDAAQLGVRISITQVALGAGIYDADNDTYQGYTPDKTQQALMLERDRVPISEGEIVNNNQLHVSAAITGNQTYEVREIGIYVENRNQGPGDSENVLFAVYAVAEGEAHIFEKNADVDVLIGFDLLLDANVPEDTIIVDGETQLALPAATNDKRGVIMTASAEDVRTAIYDATLDSQERALLNSKAITPSSLTVSRLDSPIGELDMATIDDAGNLSVRYNLSVAGDILVPTGSINTASLHTTGDTLVEGSISVPTGNISTAGLNISGNALNVEAPSVINQDLTTDATPKFAGLDVSNLNAVTRLDAITNTTIENAIENLPNLSSIQGRSVDFSGSLTIEANSRINQDLTTDASVTFARVNALSGINVNGGNDRQTNHISTDGAFYRHDGQVYITVDDNLYVRDLSGSVPFRFQTDSGDFRANGVVTANQIRAEHVEVRGELRIDEGIAITLDDRERQNHWEVDGAFYRYNGNVYITVDDLLYIRDRDASGASFVFDTNTATFFCSTVFEFSDVRLKTNIQPIEGAIDAIKKINGVYYHWSEHERNRANSQERKIGLIADEVEKVFPEFVQQDKEGFKSLEYSHFNAVLLQAIKEQQVMLEKQQDQINQLSELVSLLNEKVAS